MKQLEHEHRIYSYPRASILLSDPNMRMCCWRFVDIDYPDSMIEMDVIHHDGEDAAITAYKQAYFCAVLTST